MGSIWVEMVLNIEFQLATIGQQMNGKSVWKLNEEKKKKQTKSLGFLCRSQSAKRKFSSVIHFLRLWRLPLTIATMLLISAIIYNFMGNYIFHSRILNIGWKKWLYDTDKLRLHLFFFFFKMLQKLKLNCNESLCSP